MILARAAFHGQYNQERWTAYKRSSKPLLQGQMPQLFVVALGDMGETVMMHLPCTDEQRVEWFGNYFSRQHDEVLYKSPLFAGVRAMNLFKGQVKPSYIHATHDSVDLIEVLIEGFVTKAKKDILAE